MSFEVTRDAYSRFMGRFSEPLAERFVDLVAPGAEQRVLDVGCGSGALTSVLVDRVGASSVSAVDPSESFVSSVSAAFPGMDVRRARAEDLPFEDDAFDLVLAQLVVHFMSDPVRGLAEMGRVAVPGGVVAASVWDHAGGQGPLAVFWSAVRSLDASAPDESHLPGVAEGHPAELFEAAGLRDAVSTALTVTVEHPTFEEWWEPFTLGVGPAGVYVEGLGDGDRAALEAECRRRRPSTAFVTDATAWTVVART
jgi:SAM-dependent methyltransferase